MAGRTQTLQQSPILGLDPNFDQIGALLQAANQALTRAMNATPIVTKPSDVKALVDAASNALKLIETIKNQSTGKVSRDEVAKELARVLDLVREARLRDIDELVKAELAKRGIEAEPEAKSASSGEAVAVEHDGPDKTEAPPELTNGREKPETTAEPCQPNKTGVRRFTEVLAEMRAAADIAAEN
jgi:hypothetical protein